MHDESGVGDDEGFGGYFGEVRSVAAGVCDRVIQALLRFDHPFCLRSAYVEREIPRTAGENAVLRDDAGELTIG